METLERNRVFDKPALEELLRNGTALFEQAIAITGVFESQATQVWHQVSQVPGEAKDAGLSSYCMSLLTSSAFRTDPVLYEDIITRLTTYLNRLLELVYAFDNLAGTTINDVTACVQELGGVSDQLKELLTTGIINRKMKEFDAYLETYISQWHQSLLSYEEKIALAGSVLKGMQDRGYTRP